MAIEKIFFRDFLEEQYKNPPFRAGAQTNRASGLVLDVRSPSEYKQAHYPGAISLPLFSDEERRIIGTAYKQESREVAVRLGLDFFSPRMKSMIDEVLALMEKTGKGKTQPIFVYCWRGGMRSGAVAWLLDLYGLKVKQMAGGYKSFRRWSLETLSQPYHFQILGGYTGSGKTELLLELKKHGQPIVDLEGIAGHKGSAFGNLDREEQPSQEMFENKLALALHELNKENREAPAIWLEDESQRIGSVNLPVAIWNNMRSSPISFLEIPFEERLNHVVQEYGVYDKQLLSEAIERITKRLGGLEAKNAIAFLEEGNIRAAFAILLHYYDKKYYKSLHNREGIASLLTNVPCDKVSPDNAIRLLMRELSTTSS